MDAVRNRLTRWLSPPDEMDARLRIEQLRAVACNARFVIFDPILILLLTLIDLQWVSLSEIAPWSIASLAAAALTFAGSYWITGSDHAPARAGRLTLIALVTAMPLLAIWPAMTLFVWHAGDPLNNAYLLTFIFASMAIGVAMFGASPHIMVPGLVIGEGMLATHTMFSPHAASWLGTSLQVIAGFSMCGLSYVFYQTFRDSAVQRIEKEQLAVRLQVALEEVARARDVAETANQAKSTFLANMSHELRTPLNAIIGFADLMRHRVLGPMSPAKYGEYVDDVYRSGNHLLSLINDILDLAKIEAGRRELHETEIDIARVAAEAIAFVAPQSKAAQVDVRARVAVNALFADERSVLQILTNLLSNAVKFSSLGGQVVLFAEPAPDGGITLGVEDQGVGMDAEGLRKALEPFGQATDRATVDGHGTGLGLPIVKALVELHDGQFSLESEKGKGSRASATFPKSRTTDRRAVA